MFTRWGELVYKLRYTVLGVAVAALLALGAYGFGLENHLSSSGWFDPGAESSEAAVLKDQVYGRDHLSDVIVLYTAPDGKTVDDPDFGQKITENLNSLPKEYPDQITKVNVAYWKTETGDWSPSATGSKDKKNAFASIAIKGDNDTEMVNNYRKVKDVFYIPGVDVQVAGMQPVAGTLNDTIASDQKRMEMLAIPLVGILLFFIFGGVVAAALPLIVGGLTILGANGIVMGITHVTEVNSFVGAVVSMIGLGLAIDYGLFIVSRFREEMAEGYTTRVAVRRAVMTAGRTVVFSATMIIAASAGMLLFPQGFLKSVAYGTIATVLLAAVASLTILPALLAILGRRVDALGFKRFRKTKTAEEVENGFWGRTTQWVMKHPLKVAIPIVIILLLLIIPVKNLKFGGISETYLPPDNPTRMAQEEFDRIFPLRQTDPVQLVITTDNSSEIKALLDDASNAPGLANPFGTPGIPPNGSNVWVSETTLAPDANVDDTIAYLRTIAVPDDVQLLVGGQPVLMQDSITSLLDRMPLMIVLVVFVTTLLMFLTFGSLVLPIKAALMSALGLGSTLGILTWIFVDGHGAGLLNFTPQPIMSPVLVLIMAVIYGLSTDYEVFLLSRMVESRAQGASTTEAVRSGTAQTGRIITAAALILLVVVGAFAFSDLVMMQYIAYGMMAALFIDATVLRMLLVPATMKLLGDDCWWAPTWMKRVQQRVGLGEPILDDERPGTGELVDLVKTTPVTDPVTMQLPQMPDGTTKGPKKPRRLKFLRVDPEAPTEQLTRIDPNAVASGSGAAKAGTAKSAKSVADADAPDSGAAEPGATSEAAAEPAAPAKQKRYLFRRGGGDADAPAADSGTAASASSDAVRSDGAAKPAASDPADAGAAPARSPSNPVPPRPTNQSQTPGNRSSRVLPPQSPPAPGGSGAANIDGVIGAVGGSDPSVTRGAPDGFGMPGGPGASNPAGTRGPAGGPPPAPGGFGPAAHMRAAGAADRTAPERNPAPPEGSGGPHRPAAPPSVSLPNGEAAPNRGGNQQQPPNQQQRVARPGIPPRTVPGQDTPPDGPGAVPPTAPVGTTPRVLPPKPSKLPPHPSVRAQLYRPDAPPYHTGQAPAADPGAEAGAGPGAHSPRRAEPTPPAPAEQSPWMAPENRMPSVQPPRRVAPEPTPPTAPIGTPDAGRPVAPPAEPAPTEASEQVPADTESGHETTPPAHDSAEERPERQAPTAPGGDNRNNIEQWMADLRSSRRRPEPEDEDAKNHNSGRTVSVNELLRRQNRD
ncbi:MMPL family transporter [Nocardia spumae]|uniref:MMPL family transporter n=1 Tax=Nocardia spumae TaxID=2887190 RepID=UPI0035564B26